MLTKADIEIYFMAEKHESLLFLVVGLAAILLALIFYFSIKTPVYRGAAIPLIIFGLIQAIAGYTVYQRSDDQRINQVYAYDMNPGQLKSVELARMTRVNRNFNIYRWIEIGGVVTGVLLILIFRNAPKAHFWVGLGLALAFMTAELYIADYIAAKRALQYTGLLEKFEANERANV